MKLVLLGVALCALSVSAASNDRDIVIAEGGENGDKDFERSTEYEPLYCEQKDAACDKGETILSIFGSYPRACATRCNRYTNCASVTYSGQTCHLHSDRCTKDELTASKGDVTLYRRKKGEKCSEEVGEDFVSEIKYSRKFCRLVGYKCPERGIGKGSLYKRPQNITPWLVCLLKCARIRVCTGVDFFEGQGKACDIRSTMCSDDELVEDANAINFIRLEEGDDECPEDRDDYTLPDCDDEV